MTDYYQKTIEWVDEVLKINPNTINDYKNGKKGALEFLVGQTMKVSKGAADPALVKDLLMGKLLEMCQ